MNLPNDRLREAILQELNRAIWTRYAQGASFEAVMREYGLSKESLYLIAEHDGSGLGLWRSPKTAPIHGGSEEIE